MNDRNSNASMVGDTNLLSGIGCAGSLFSYIFLSLIPLVIMFLNVYLSIIVSIASTLIFVTFIFIYKQSYDDRKHIDSINFHQCLIMMLSMIFVLISVIPLLENIFELSETSMAICAIAATTFFIIFSVFISDLLKNDDDSTANDWNNLSFISFLFSFILIVQYIKFPSLFDFLGITWVPQTLVGIRIAAFIAITGPLVFKGSKHIRESYCELRVQVDGSVGRAVKFVNEFVKKTTLEVKYRFTEILLLIVLVITKIFILAAGILGYLLIILLSLFIGLFELLKEGLFSRWAWGGLVMQLTLTAWLTLCELGIEMARIGVQPTGEESLAKEAAKLMIVGIAVIGLASLCERLLVGKREEQSFEGIFRAIALFIVAAWGSTLTAAAVGYWLINPYSVTLLAKAFLFGFPVVAAGVFFGTMFLDPNDGSSHAA